MLKILTQIPTPNSVLVVSSPTVVFDAEVLRYASYWPFYLKFDYNIKEVSCILDNVLSQKQTTLSQFQTTPLNISKAVSLANTSIVVNRLGQLIGETRSTNTAAVAKYGIDLWSLKTDNSRDILVMRYGEDEEVVFMIPTTPKGVKRFTPLEVNEILDFHENILG